ncbi:HAD family hydrolase [Halobacillus sp. A5]|uniref:HAD family hydrolase n=1 Tax=Halobacillus sp. A5 TaxID=2880263 RepID=UPI0020A65ADE|nr:HAD family hydrolase [Halobacillus sp. A5]MCP3027883.1 HAD family hydrolase [Halobacillus sp. A5]
MIPKAIALDLDGTLLNEENEVTEELLTLLPKLQQEYGIRIFVASGRTKLEIEDVLPSSLQVDGVVTANGMGGYSGARTLFEYTLDPELVHNVVEEARNHGIYYEVHPMKHSRIALKEDQNLLKRIVHAKQPDTLLDNEYYSRKQAVQSHIDWVDHLSYESIVKVYFFSMDPEIIKEWKEALKSLNENHRFSIYSSSLHNAEIMDNKASKARGLEYLLKEFGIPATKTMAIGDGENDLPMLKLAGYSVAMQNAEEVVKQNVHEVTKNSYKQNGLYEFLMKKIR